MKFQDRENELALLNEIYGRKGPQFIVLYGRRRIGKTALITHWLKTVAKSDAVYWVAHKSSSGMLLEKFSRAVCSCLPDVREGVVFRDWETGIHQVFDLAKKRKLILAIDEFPYLVESVPECVSLLQAAWDHQSEDSRLILILSGSQYNMMRKEFISGRGPLYGRSTADILLEEIAPGSIRLFLPRYSPNQIVETFSIIGGVPKYLEMWDDRKPVLANIKNILLSPVTIFRQEAIFLIQDEIPEPRTYLAILEAIGCGAKSPSTVSKQTGIAINHMGKYLRSLLDLGFIRRIISLDAPRDSTTRLSRYEIKDSYLKFYFTYIYPNLELVEQQRYTRLLEIIKESFDSFVGRTGYEELARRFIIRLGDSHELPFVPDRVGRIWSKVEEIDLAAVDRKSRNILLGECKWTGRKLTNRTLDRLVEKSKSLAKIKDYKIQYMLFARSGFTAPLIERARKENVLLFEGSNFDSMKHPL